jgi:GTP-binding protein Era
MLRGRAALVSLRHWALHASAAELLPPLQRAAASAAPLHDAHEEGGVHRAAAGGGGGGTSGPAGAAAASYEALPPPPPPSADATPTPISEAEQLLVRVGVLGVPNAGKSTLTNALAGAKVSAVSSKTNTTARTHLGAFTRGAAQAVLLDTPGVVGAAQVADARHARRVRSAWAAAGAADLLLLVVDAERQLARADPRVERLVERFGSGAAPPGFDAASWAPPPAALVLNKVDAVPPAQRRRLLGLADAFAALAGFEEVFWVSALRGTGVRELGDYVLSRAKPGAWAVEGGASTDAGEAEMAAECVREQLFRRFYKELPYRIELKQVDFKTLRDGSTRAELDVIVPDENVRMIVVGAGGAAIGVVGRAARLELEALWKRRVHLILNVKARK